VRLKYCIISDVIKVRPGRKLGEGGGEERQGRRKPGKPQIPATIKRLQSTALPSSIEMSSLEDFLSSQEAPPPGLSPAIAGVWPSLPVDARRVFVKTLLANGLARRDENAPFGDPFSPQNSSQPPSGTSIEGPVGATNTTSFTLDPELLSFAGSDSNCE
jgi:hypothetical protein